MDSITPITFQAAYKDFEVKASYSKLVHTVIMEASRKFADDLHESREKSDNDHWARQERTRKDKGEALEAEKRHRDNFTEANCLNIVAERQANLFNALEGSSYISERC